MKKTIGRCAIIAVTLTVVLCFSAPVRAEMPVGWVSDLVAWYLEQNGVGGGEGGPNIVVLLPGTSFDSDTTPGSDNPVFEVITGANDHYVYGFMLNQHRGVLYGAGSDIDYSFCAMPWGMLAYWFPGTYVPYCNGLANTSEMFGDIKWNWVSYLGSGQNGFTITMDFYHNGMRYGLVVNNKGVGVKWECPYGKMHWFQGTYSGIRTSAMGPPTRDSYMGRGALNGFAP